MTISLNDHLQGLTADVLKGWLRRVDAFDKDYTRKEHLTRAVEQQLTLHLPLLLARLSEAEKMFLAESVHQKRVITPREFTAKHGGACPMSSNYCGRGEEVSLLLPFIHDDYYQGLGTSELIPSLMQPLRALLPKPAGFKIQTVEELPKSWAAPEGREDGDPDRAVHVFESERLAPVELARILRLIQGGKIKVTDATHRPTDATTRLVREALAMPDFDLEMPIEHRDEWQRKYYEAAGPVRAHAWPVLVQQCGWAKPKGGTLTLTVTGREMLQQFTPEKFRDGVSHALANDDFDELNRINNIRGQSGKAKRWMSKPGLRKDAIAEALTALPIGAWVGFENVQRLAEASPECWEVLSRGHGMLYFAELQYGCIYENDGINRQFLRAFLMETLATIGVLDIAYIYPHSLWPDLSGLWGTDDLAFCGRYDGLLYVRLNPLGAYALGVSDRYALQTEPRPKLFRVLPNHDLVLTHGQLNPADRAALELLAAPRTEYIWKIEAERMLSHVAAGGAFQELRDFLEAHAEEGLPDNVRVFLSELESKLGACRARREAVLLEWGDDALAQLIATSPGLKKLCFHAGGDRIVVPAANLGAFSRAAMRLGFVLPRTG